MHRKLALEISTPSGFIPKTTAAVANTFGRVSALAAALLLGQEKALM